jgi:hypothetical protein
MTVPSSPARLSRSATVTAVYDGVIGTAALTLTGPGAEQRDCCDAVG